MENMQKYGNYTENMGQLKKAMASHFFLEAVFIEYAVIEDRTESILRHTGVFNPEKHNTLAKKIGKIKEVSRNKNALLNKYITEEMMDNIREWSKKRNELIHDLLRQNLSSGELEQIALQGQKHAKLLCSKVTSYKRAIERVVAQQ